MSKTNADQSKPVDWDKAKPFDAIPGPPSVPILGYFWNILPKVGKYHGLDKAETQLKLHDQYGDLVRLRGLKVRKDIVYCFNPQDIETVYRNEGPTPVRESLPLLKYYRLEMRKDLYQGFGGVFAMDGNEWTEARSKLNEIFLQPRTVKNYVQLKEDICDEFIERMKFLANEDPQGVMPDDFMYELNKWAFETAAIITLDAKLGLLKPNPSPEHLQMLDAILDMFTYFYKVEFQPSFAKYISTPDWRRYVKILDKVTYFLKNELDKIVKIKEESINKDESKMTAIEMLLKLDRKMLLGAGVDMYLGGVDTTTKALSSALYHLATNAEPQTKLREELLRVLPEKEARITPDKLEQMPYLKAVIKETFRISPLALALRRTTVKDLVLSGYQVPKGTNLLLAQLALFWKDEYFPKAKIFIPERWLRNSTLKNPNYNPWMFQPFGYGPRSCLGRRIAQQELEVMIAKIIRNFKLDWHQPEMKFKTVLFYGIDRPLKLTVTLVDK